MMNLALIALAFVAILPNPAHAEGQTLASTPYDCLAGACLNTSTAGVPDTLVTVSEVVMQRRVEVCSGRIVAISVAARWLGTQTASSADMFSGAQHRAVHDGWTAATHNDQIRSEMCALGWRLYAPCTDEALCSPNLYVHPDKKGDRWTDYQLRQSGSGPRDEIWEEILMTTHPDKDALCAPKRQQGL